MFQLASPETTCGSISRDDIEWSSLVCLLSPASLGRGFIITRKWQVAVWCLLGQNLRNDPPTNWFKEVMTEFTYNAMPSVARNEALEWKSLGLATAVHLFLLAFLWIGVQWQSQESTAVEAKCLCRHFSKSRRCAFFSVPLICFFLGDVFPPWNLWLL